VLNLVPHPRGKHRLRIIEKNVVKRISGAKKVEVRRNSGNWIKRSS
jgi:hypothetical protein